MVVYDKKYAGKPTLKKRGWVLNKQPKIYFGETAIIVNNCLRFEFPYLFFMRKFIKKCLKKKKFFKKTRKIWVFIRPNHVLSKKAKNARMGKGKGSLTRWCSILPKGFTLIEFLGIPSIRVRKYKIRLEKKFKVPLSMIDRPIRYTKLLKSHFLGSNKTLAVRDFKYNIYI